MSNKIPCGGFYLDDTLNVNESGELSIKGGTPYQQLVTDGEGSAKWEDKPYFKVNVIGNSGDNVELDATKEEIYSAFQAGKTVTVNFHGIELKGIYIEGEIMQFYGTVPHTVGSNGVVKIAVYYLHATLEGWRFSMNTISTDTQ